MAKGNPFLGTVSGSFGDLTLKNYRGKQVLTRKSTKPHNPRTSKQIYQRMFFATVGKARAALKNIIDHSFEQVPHGVDSLNYFQKRNVALFRENAVYDYGLQTWVSIGMNFVGPKSAVFAANPYQISEGSLPSISEILPFPDNTTEVLALKEPNQAYTIMPWISTSLDGWMSQDEAYPEAMAKEDLKVGDYLTAVFISAPFESLMTSPIHQCSLHFVRYKVVMFNYSDDHEGENGLVLYPTNVDGLDFNVPDLVVDDAKPIQLFQNDDKTDSQKYGKFYPYIDFSNPNSVSCQYMVEDVTLSAPFKAPLRKGLDYILAGAWIHSRPDDDTILVSSQKFIMRNNGWVDIVDPLKLPEAFELWTKEGKSIGDARYLLEGGDV